MATTRTVQLGDRGVVIEGFRAFKAIRVGEVLTRITESVPGIVEFMAAYNRTNTQTRKFGRATFTYLYASDAARISDAAWEAENNTIEIEEEPDMAEVIMAAFPRIFTAAKDNLLELLALVAVPNSDLRKADEEGDGAVQDVINKLKKDMLHDATVEQLIDLAVAALEVVKEQFAGKAEELKRMLNLLGLTTTTPTSEESQTTPETETMIGSTPKNGAPDSSSDSSDSDGPETPSSTGSRSESLFVSGNS